MTELEKIKQMIGRTEEQAKDLRLAQLLFRQISMSELLLDKSPGEMIIALLQVVCIKMWDGDLGRKENEEAFEAAASYLLTTCELNCRAREENHGK